MELQHLIPYVRKNAGWTGDQCECGFGGAYGGAQIRLDNTFERLEHDVESLEIPIE